MLPHGNPARDFLLREAHDFPECSQSPRLPILPSISMCHATSGTHNCRSSRLTSPGSLYRIERGHLLQRRSTRKWLAKTLALWHKKIRKTEGCISLIQPTTQLRPFTMRNGAILLMKWYWPPAVGNLFETIRDYSGTRFPFPHIYTKKEGFGDFSHRCQFRKRSCSRE